MKCCEDDSKHVSGTKVGNNTRKKTNQLRLVFLF